MVTLAEQLISCNDIVLAVATVYDGRNIRSFQTGRIIYYLLPVRSKTSYHKEFESYWQKICSDFKPDVVHIHGTEFSHGLACLRACPDLNFVISLQGIVNVIARYFFGSISQWEIFYNITIRDIIRRDSLF